MNALRILLLALLLGGTALARAEPYLALAQGLKCAACHVNATGGGLRSALGIAFARQAMPMAPLPAGAPEWSGALGERVRVGGDLRHRWSRSTVPGQPAQRDWALDALRLYGFFAPLPERVTLHVDQLLAPGSSRAREAYVRLSADDGRWALKAGQFYLPFGWRLQDDSAFVRQLSGVTMSAPDSGVEVGLELPEVSAQLALTNGAANAGTGSGHQLIAQAAWVRARGRLGAALSATRSDAGDRHMAALFGGLRTGPLAWLGEVDFVRDEGFAGGARSLRAALLEVNWGWRRGHNLKLSAEHLDPDRRVPENHSARWSVIYEATPLPFVQLRLGARRWDGIPQNAFDNRRLLFFEVHAFL